MPSKRAFASGMPRKEAPWQRTCAPARANTKKRAPRSTPLKCIYRYGTTKSRYFACLECAAAGQHYFACLAFFVLSPFLELIAAFTAPINAGATDTATMPKTMTSK